MRNPNQSVAKQVGWGILNFAVTIGLLILIIASTRGRVPNLAGLTLTAAAALGAYLAGSRWIERRPPPELIRANLISECGAGFGAGMLLFSAVMGLLWALGVYHPTGFGNAAALGSGLLVAWCQGIVEEVIVRGFVFRVVSIATGTWIAILFSAALFGGLHAYNPGATAFSSIAIALEAGVLLAAAYVVTGRLWLPIALHAAWNFTEGSVFGMSVSGGKETASLITGTLKGPAILTGGAFGPEASALAVGVCLALAFALLRRAVQTHRIEGAPWNRSSSGAA